jgi:transcriptional regulator with XRE-family HTH domain
MDLKKIFISNLKRYRKAAGLSQMKLAEKCGTDASYIGQIEIDIRFPSLDMIEKMACALHVEPYRLFIDENKKTDSIATIPSEIRREIIERLSVTFDACVKQALEIKEDC